MEHTTHKRRADLDFLRSMAIIFVLGYHLRWPALQNGFIGVDVFFVLSGYLMGKIVAPPIASGTFSFRRFYLKRAERILLPLLALVISFLLLVCTLLGIKAYDYAKDATSSILFVSNVYYYLQSGYFSPKGELNFMLHTWSLSLEMQYYLILPVVLAMANRLGQGRMTSACASLALACLSYLAMVYLGQRDQSFAFYMLPARFWEFMAGVLVWAITGSIKDTGTRKKKERLLRSTVFYVAVCVLLLCASGTIPLASFQWPGSGTLLVVACSATAIAIDHGSALVKWKVFGELAKRSYALYLWHWPMIVLFRYFGVETGDWHSLYMLSISFAMACLSYSLVERRYGTTGAGLPRRAMVMVILGTFTVAMCLTAGALFRRHGELSSFMYGYHADHAPEQFGFDISHIRYNQDTASFRSIQDLAFDPERPNYLLIGDCYAAMFSATLRRAAEQRGVNLIQLTADDTFPTPESPSDYTGPGDFMRGAFSGFIPSNRDRIQGIIIMANYSAYGRSQLGRYIERNRLFFTRLGIPITYIGQVAGYRIEAPVAAWMHQRYGIPPERYVRNDRRRAGDFVRNAAGKERYIDILAHSGTRFSDGRSVMLYDTEHYSTYGTEQFMDLLKGAFSRAVHKEKK